MTPWMVQDEREPKLWGRVIGACSAAVPTSYLSASGLERYTRAKALPWLARARTCSTMSATTRSFALQRAEMRFGSR